MLNSPLGKTTKDGHYVAVIRETEDGDRWIYVNDDDSHETFPTADLNDKNVNKALGLPGDPYAFVYKRVNLTPLDTFPRIQADPLPPTVDPEPPSQSTVDSEPPSPPTLPPDLPPINQQVPPEPEPDSPPTLPNLSPTLPPINQQVPPEPEPDSPPTLPPTLPPFNQLVDKVYLSTLNVNTAVKSDIFYAVKSDIFYSNQKAIPSPSTTSTSKATTTEDSSTSEVHEQQEESKPLEKSS